MITPQQATAFLSLAEGKKHIVITAHMSPDGDAMGSSLALKRILRKIYGTSVSVVVPNRYPAFLAWLPEAGEVVVYEEKQQEADALFAEADLICILDYCELKRVGAMAERIEQSSAPRVLIDHHIRPEGTIADVEMSYHEAPATAFLVLDLWNRIAPVVSLDPQSDLDKDTATCIYTGLMTDTGSFSYNANLPEIYEQVAQLLRAGVEKDTAYDNVFNQFSVERLRFTGFCLYHKMRIFPRYHTALIALSSDELKRFNFQSGDAEGIVNMPLQIANVHYSVFMREDTDKIKISFRSQGDRPVNEYAAEYWNGGGHKNAAGGDSHSSLQDTVKKFETTYQKWFRTD